MRGPWPVAGIAGVQSIGNGHRSLATPATTAPGRNWHSIGIFAVGADGQLTPVGNEWTRGNYPRSFNTDPTGRFLYSCNQRADNIAVFAVNSDTGALRFTDQYTPVGNPSIIVFQDLKKIQ